MKQLTYTLLLLVLAAGNVSAQNLNTTSLLLVDDGSGNSLILSPASLTGNRTFIFPDASGTIAMSGSISFSIGSTLLGDGSGGDPLRINLSNTNTWTGTQTFGQIGVLSIATFDADMALGDSPTDAITVNGTVAGATPLSFEGATSDVNETSFAFTDPTADRTITFPDASGTVAFLSDLGVTTNSTLLGDGSGGDPLRINLSNTNTWTGTQTFGQIGVLSIATFDADMTLGDSPTDAITMNGTLAGATPLSFEGATSDVNETTFAITDPTADRTITFQDASGTVAFLSDVAVTTNSTLLGDGTGGDPLRINLSNTNTWTGTQTFGQIGVLSIATFDADMTLGDSPTDAITMNGTLAGATPLSFEGATSDVNETTFAITDPTADRTITFQDASGTVAFLSDVAVTTNSTLLGDGTGGDPLRINLSNANTWTGTQTLPVTAAQGDALIASTNAGTTTIDAARIGAGLTDAQVNDNLTINGGTVDASPIGATTPSTGGFTTLAATSTITGGSSLTLGDDATPTAGTVVLNDNTSANGFEGTILTVAALTADRTYTLPDADGTIALVGNVSVSTDATLTGDGTVGTPLGIDLTNANTWTGTQTLPTTAAQGDALIASTNAGTTTIDAARIGAGLTDAQVNDNLTINGGTVDASPIGATTPSTGGFTTLAATSTITGGSSLTLGDDATPTAGTVVLNDNTSANGFEGTILTVAALTADRTYTLPDADGTIALVGNVSVSTDATLTGDGTVGTPLGIDLTNANTWTGTQTLPATAAQGDALIASTNAGTTTIDAARIGAGLTDAQVNDNLTINGGTVDASPVGATTPSTGAFTTLTATSTFDAQAPGNLVGNGADAEQLQIDGQIGGVVDVDINGDVDISGTLTLGVLAMNGNLDMNGNNIVDVNNLEFSQAASLISNTGGDVTVSDNLVVTGTSDLRGAVSNTTGDLTIADVVTVNSGGSTDLSFDETSIVRNSAATETLAFDNTGAGNLNVLINGATSVTNSRLTVDEGHWTSQGTAPTAAGDGTNLAAGVTVSTTATDVAGFLTSTDGGTIGNGVITVTFSSAYATDPVVVVTPGDAATAGAGFYVNNITTTTFDINVATTLGDGTTTYSFYYHVIEND